MDTQTDYDREAAAQYCRERHLSEQLGCEECEIRTSELTCQLCDRQVCDGEVVEVGHSMCSHDVVDGFDKSYPGIVVDDIRESRVGDILRALVLMHGGRLIDYAAR